MLGTYALSAGYYDAYYGKAQKVRTLICRDFAAAYERRSTCCCRPPRRPRRSTSAPRPPTRSPCTSTTSARSRPTWPATPPSPCPSASAPTACPSGVQVLAPALGEPRCSRWPPPCRGGRAADRVDARHPSGGARLMALPRRCWELVVRPRGPLRAGHRHQAVLRLRPTSSATSPTPTSCPVSLGLPGLAAGAQPAGRRAGHALRRRRSAATSCRSIVQPEELLLSGHAEGLPDLPVRPADQRRRPPRAARRVHGSASSGPTSRRTPASPPTSAGPGRINGADHSLVDYNRAGVPLRRDRLRPRHPLRRAGPGRTWPSCARSSWPSGVSDGKMEEGSHARRRQRLRAPRRRPALGTRCEIKNLNSLRSLVRAIEYEAARQADLARGRRARSSRRPATGTRTPAAPAPCARKEEADDYRYFPEPDLVPLDPSARVDRRGEGGAAAAAGGPPPDARRGHRGRRDASRP